MCLVSLIVHLLIVYSFEDHRKLQSQRLAQQKNWKNFVVEVYFCLVEHYRQGKDPSVIASGHSES